MAELLKATGIYYRNELRSIHKNGVKLQPVYEAFTNSWESILEKYTAEHLNLGSIVIEFHYNAGMFEEDNENNLTYIIHSGFISGYQNRYGDNLKPPTNVYHRMTA